MVLPMVYKNESFHLTDEFIDIGYMAEEIEVQTLKGEPLLIHKTSSKRSIQIFLSFPSFDEFKEEIMAFDAFINEAKVDIDAYIIFDKNVNCSYNFKKLIPVLDTQEDYGNMYGTKIVSGSLTGKLTKALFVIGKDGAVYHIDMPTNLEDSLDIQRIRVELNKAYQSYTGVGCHG
jgi:peroxiredoxin